MRRLGVLLLAVLLAGCGDDFAKVEPDNPSRSSDGLVVTRTDGATYRISNATAICRTAAGKPGVAVVRLTAPAGATPGRGSGGWFLADVLLGATGRFRLPLAQREAGPSDVTVLAPASPRHQVSGWAPGASGTVTVREATCDPEPRVALTIDATLVGRDGVRVKVSGGIASSGR
jgi:hypothetical protein